MTPSHSSIGESSTGHSSIDNSSWGHSSISHSIGHGSRGHSSRGHSSIGRSSRGHSSTTHSKCREFQWVLQCILLIISHTSSWVEVEFTHTQVNIVCIVLYLLERSHVWLGTSDIIWALFSIEKLLKHSNFLYGRIYSVHNWLLQCIW